VYQFSRLEENRPKNEDVVYIDHPKRWLLRKLFFGWDELLHCHEASWKLIVVMGILGFFGRKTILTIHGASLEDSLRDLRGVKRWVLRMALRHVTFIVAVNTRIRDVVLLLGVRPDRIAVIPAFVPPRERQSDMAAIPEQVWEFIDSHYPIISANAHKIVFYKGYDLYGIDMCVDLCARLKSFYPQVGFVFCLPSIGDENYFNTLQQKIASKGISENWLFQTTPCQLYPIIKRSHLFVRPTITDGFGVSVAEAIYFGVPAVASDVCERPKGTIVFRNRDLDDFVAKVKDVIDNYDVYRKMVADVSLDDYPSQLVTIYRKVLGHYAESF
jgi:glycosyltransferase involved in cell wall biosynthesis